MSNLPSKDERSWDEDDIELAERYANALKDIAELLEEINVGEDEVELAERYAAALREIDERR